MITGLKSQVPTSSSCSSCPIQAFEVQIPSSQTSHPLLKASVLGINTLYHQRRRCVCVFLGGSKTRQTKHCEQPNNVSFDRSKATPITPSSPFDVVLQDRHTSYSFFLCDKYCHKETTRGSGFFPHFAFFLSFFSFFFFWFFLSWQSPKGWSQQQPTTNHQPQPTTTTNTFFFFEPPSYSYFLIHALSF